ncbi:MAG: DNA repair protein RecN [Hydrogenibacillus sp.]|nr:DNA repair protein RecN [Hydrogenibacillus sp.]
MLASLSVENIAVFKEVHVDWHGALNVITGESGAGKSVLLDALTLLIGERAREETVRRGAPAAVIEGRWILDALHPEVLETLAAHGVPFDPEDGVLIIRREIVPGGRSTVRMNGVLVPLNALRTVAPHLIILHRQHDQLLLADAARQRAWVDALGGEALKAARERYQAAYGQYVDAYRAAKDAEAAQAAEEEERRRLQEALEEIVPARLKPGEDEALVAKRARLLNAERIKSALAKAYQAISGEHRALDLLRLAENALEGVGDADPDLASLGEQVREHVFALEEIARTLFDAGEALDAAGESLEAVESRLDVIERLKKRYGGSVEAVIRFAEKAEARLLALADGEAKRQKRLLELDARRDAWLQAGAALTEARRQAAKTLEARVAEYLRTLHLPKARFAVAVDVRAPEGPLPDPAGYAHGLEDVSFWFQANPGDVLRPLSKVASGGEMSRVALSLFAAFADALPRTTFIFDEIDTGVGGPAGEAIGEAMAGIAKAHQVLAVTHLAQVASFADAHFCIVKRTEGRETTSSIVRLDEAAHLKELARLISGEVVTDAALAHAAMLSASAADKKNAIRA